MYNEYVKLYCEHYGLKIQYNDQKNYIYEKDNAIGFYTPNEKIVYFFNGSVFKKGDLMLSILENTKLH